LQLVEQNLAGRPQFTGKTKIAAQLVRERVAAPIGEFWKGDCDEREAGKPGDCSYVRPGSIAAKR
jgi:hypothetical protein